MYMVCSLFGKRSMLSVDKGRRERESLGWFIYARGKAAHQGVLSGILVV
jgi:hypothetical protein